jgi:hypothetical protein
MRMKTAENGEGHFNAREASLTAQILFAFSAFRFPVVSITKQIGGVLCLS